MNTAVSTDRSDYLARVAAGLSDLTEEDRAEVIQDLRAHLAELDHDAIESTLGTPAEFVAEFRASAGLDQVTGVSRKWSLAKTRSRLEEFERRLAALTRWQTIRPVWIWTRGWLLIGTFAVLSGGTAFRRFPIPTIEHSTTIGLAAVVAATWLSVWLDRRKTPVRRVGSFVFNSLVVVFLLSGVLWVRDVARVYPHVEEAFYPNQIVGPEGEPINNIYAYDIDGNPVEVLLFDEIGRPLKNLPSWVYEEAERNPGVSEPFEYGSGLVEFERDEFGRIIPNLYPLDLYTYGPYGPEPVVPPQLGFPGSTEAAEEQAPVTTISTAPAG